jgi:MinD superfamily P-loop ATPase
MEKDSIKIAVLSGKGGVGKTLVSVNLAAAAKHVYYIDCDVEAPNGHLFFKPEAVVSKKVSVQIPRIDSKLCTGCRKCSDFCKFNALAYANNRILLFDEVCHSCGGCVLLCPEKAISLKDKIIGEIRQGKAKDIEVVTGIMDIGEASGVPIIKKLLELTTNNKEYVFIDCPPGSACTVMESIRDADYCILVAEPTLFGVHNLNMVYELVKLFSKPHGVILNKYLDRDNPAEKFSISNDIKIIGKIPFDRELGLLNSNSEIAAWKNEKYSTLFSSLLAAVVKEVNNETAFNT